MKIKDFFEPHLEYRAKIGNTLKTLTEVSRFLYNPVSQAVGEIDLKDLKLVHNANVIAAGTKYGVYGSQRSVNYFRQLLEYIQMCGNKLEFDYHDIKIPFVPQGRVNYLDEKELDKVRECFDISNMQGLRTRALMEFLLDTGLRIGEAIALDKKDINFDKDEIEVRNIKTKEWQTVYFTERSKAWLKLYISKRKDECEALFISGRSRLMSVSSRNYIRQKIKHLNLGKKIAHHIFRRTLGTTLSQEKVDIKTVQEILRHASERTTLQYYVGTNRERTKAMHSEVVNRIFSKGKIA